MVVAVAAARRALAAVVAGRRRGRHPGAARRRQSAAVLAPSSRRAAASPGSRTACTPSRRTAIRRSAAEGTVRLVSAQHRPAAALARGSGAVAVDPVAGSGAGTFVFTHYRFRTSGGVVKHAHSEWFNVLSELGIVGLVLFVAAMAPVRGHVVRNPFRDRGDPLRSLVVALQAGIVAFVVHISWDWDWDMAAIGTVFFLFAAACSSYLATRAGDDAGDSPGSRRGGGRRGCRRDAGHVGRLGPHRADGRDRGGRPGLGGRRRSRRRLNGRRDGPRPLAGRVAASPALVLLAVSWTVPYLAERAANAALAESASGNAAVALSHARRAARLDPLAVDPLITEALVLQQQGATTRRLPCSTRRRACSRTTTRSSTTGRAAAERLRPQGRRHRRAAARPRAQPARRGEPLRTADGPRALSLARRIAAAVTRRRAAASTGSRRYGRLPAARRSSSYSEVIPQHGFRPDRRRRHGLCRARLGGLFRASRPSRGLHGRRRRARSSVSSRARCRSTSPASTSSSTTTPSRLSFTTSYDELLDHCRILFIAVDTPPSPSGDADLVARAARHPRDRGARRRAASRHEEHRAGGHRREGDGRPRGTGRRGVHLRLQP